MQILIILRGITTLLHVHHHLFYFGNRVCKALAVMVRLKLRKTLAVMVRLKLFNPLHSERPILPP